MNAEPPLPTLEPATDEAKRYQRLKQRAVWLSLGLHALVLTAAALLLGPRLDAWVRDPIGETRWMRLVALAGLYAVAFELVSLPVDFWSGYLLEHRFGLSTQTLGGWVRRRLKSYLLGGPLGLALLLALYALLWTTGEWWWLLAAVGWLLLTLVLGRLLPTVILPLFYKVTPLDDAALIGRLRHLAEGTGLDVSGVYTLHLSAETRKANAALAGLGRSRRVLLGDTLLSECSPEEVEIVFAHELGHFVHRHLMKMVAAQVLLTAAGFWLIDQLGGWLAPALGYPAAAAPPAYADPSALPLLLLILSVTGLLAAPGMNALSRFFERQCDRYALRRTGQPDAFRSVFTKLSAMNKSDPDPHPVTVWLFHDHPPVRARLALADEFAL